MLTAKEHKIQVCDHTTGHTVKTVALCDDRERAEMFVQVLNNYDELYRTLSIAATTIERQYPTLSKAMTEVLTKAYKP